MTSFYNIVCIADEAYAQHTAVMLASLIDSNPSLPFRIFLMTYTMSSETKERLKKVVEGHGELHILEDDYSKSGIMALKTETTDKAWNPIMYLKLLIPQKLPVDVERFLFLDVDMVIHHSIDALYHIDLQGNVMAACDDYKFQLAHRTRLGLRTDEQYVNSGVMVIDLKAWREKETQCPMLDFLKDYKEVLNNDQDGFAIYFRGEIMLLPNRWNVTSFYFEQEPRVLDKYLAEVDDLRRNPYIIHFCEPIKPWFADCRHPYRHLYRKYLKMTPWRDERLPFFVSPWALKYWKDAAKYRLNRWGVRKESMAMVNVKPMSFGKK